MNPLCTRKLQSALIEIGHQVEKDKRAPGIPQLRALADSFFIALELGNETQQRKAANELIAGVVKWEVENL